jgi:outer membrane protein, multidrug efflux system
VANTFRIAHCAVRSAQDQLVVAHRKAENQRPTLQLTLDRLEAGLGSALDTERAQAQLSSTLAAIPALEAAAAALAHRIGVLVGRRPADVADELGEPTALPGESFRRDSRFARTVDPPGA